MTPDQYLINILAREAVDTSLNSPVRAAFNRVLPVIQAWGGNHILDIQPSGSFAKGTANLSGTDLDIFISIAQSNSLSLGETYENLYTFLQTNNWQPARQNVSINIKVNGYSVDLVPGQRQNLLTLDHSLWRRRANTWTKTNVDTHINYVRNWGRANVIRILKLWRNQKGLDFPSFYLELTVINALAGWNGGVADGVWRVLQYLRDSFVAASASDPANMSNTVSDDLSAIDKGKIKASATQALSAKTWDEIVK